MARSNEINVNECKKVVPLNTWILISNFKLAYTLLRRADGTFNRELAEFLDRKVAANTYPVDGVYSFDVYERSINLLNRIYRPASKDRTFWGKVEQELLKPLSTTEIVPVIVFFHGGSFAHSSVNSAIYDIFCRHIVRHCNAVVVSVNYRRSPENRYPKAYEDGWNALNWVHSRSWLYSGKDGVLKAHVYLAGDSSGGNIAHHVAARAAEGGVEVMGNILLHPMFGGSTRTDSETRLDGKYFVTIHDRDWYWRAFLPEGEDRDHPACNPFGPRGTDIGKDAIFPPSLVVVAGLDLSQDWQLNYVRGLKRCGQEVKLLFLEKATIGFYFMPNNEHFYNLMAHIARFIHPTDDADADADVPGCSDPGSLRCADVPGCSDPGSLRCADVPGCSDPGSLRCAEVPGCSDPGSLRCAEVPECSDPDNLRCAEVPECSDPDSRK